MVKAVVPKPFLAFDPIFASQISGGRGEKFLFLRATNWSKKYSRSRQSRFADSDILMIFLFCISFEFKNAEVVQLFNLTVLAFLIVLLKRIIIFYRYISIFFSIVFFFLIKS